MADVDPPRIPSHRLKIARAYHHLADLEEMMGDIGAPQRYPVAETFDPLSKPGEWVYALDLDHVQQTSMFTVYLGDFLFNMRSALDHLAVACAPRKYRTSISFPIFTTDPLETKPGSGEYRDPKAAKKWTSMTEGMPGAAVAALRDLQPYTRAKVRRGPPENHALAILNSLHNADEHRNLVTVITGLAKAHVSFNGAGRGQKDSQGLYSQTAHVSIDPQTRRTCR